MIELGGISKTYGTKTVLWPTDLVIESNRTTALIGPSGCGKSTLLRIIIGLVRPTSGQVTIDGASLTSANIVEARRRMGYVIQDGGLFPHLDARTNITLLARQLGWSGERAEARLSELGKLTHFPDDGLDRYPGQLSGGQRQRVSLMRALMLDPDVLLLDEPMAALDPMIRAELQRELREIFATLGKTVILVTHDIGEAAYLGDRMALLRAGRIVQEGTLSDLVRSPAEPFVTSFIKAQRGLFESVEKEGAS